MNVKVLTCTLLFVLGGNSVLAREVPPSPPDLEMLEFLGTFETVGGKDIDPSLLGGEPAPGKKPDKQAPKGGRATRKPGDKEKDGKHD